MTKDHPPYDVGYKKPPKNTRFKKGRPSPNPKGRKKGTRNFAHLISDRLKQIHTITENGIKRKMTAQEVMVEQLVVKAMRGDYKSMTLVLELYPRTKAINMAEEANKAQDAWLDSMTDEELEELVEQFRKATKENEERNKEAKAENKAPTATIMNIKPQNKEQNNHKTS